MSLETWKKEFYFVDARVVPVEQAVQHSLRKWIGLRQDNLDKHGVIIGDGYGVHLHDGVNSFDIDSTSCALCVHYLHAGEYECVACPLNLILGKRCDADECSPYNVFCDHHNPEPMIEALQEIESL